MAQMKAFFGFFLLFGIPLGDAAQAVPCPGASYLDVFNADSLSNFSYYGDHWAPGTASGYSYQVTGGELRVDPPSGVSTSFALLNDPVFDHSLSDYMLEGDFKMDLGPGIFSLVFRADAPAYEAYMFQWNGMNGRWEIEKKKYSGPGVSGYDYVAAGNPIPNYTYGTWVHLRVVVGPGNLFNAYADLNDGFGERTVFSGATDVFSTPPPYADGAVGIRMYSVTAPDILHLDNLGIYECSPPTPTPTPTPGASPTPTPASAGAGPRLYPSPVKGTSATLAYRMRMAGTMECRVWNDNGELVSEIREATPAGDRTTVLSLAGFAPGVYYYSVRLRYDSGTEERFETRKFVVLP
jgi:hypothetical protein